MTTRRFDSLQGLRGVAALSVVIGHFFALFYLTQYDQGTPLEVMRPISHLFGILAHKAVWIFFVLSGFVLTHQLCSRTYTHRQYLIARLIRLYIPVWVAIGLNVAVIYCIRYQKKEITFWLGTSPDLLSIQSLALELLLVPDGYHLGPIWSLRWEVAFSLVAFIAWRSKFLIRFPQTMGVVFIALATTGEAMGIGLLKYIPMFLVGTIIYNSIVRLGSTSSISKEIETLIIFIAVLLPTVSYVLFSEQFGLLKFTYIADVPTSLASIWLVFIALMRGSILKRILEISPLQSLGNISFSLYLFHAPVLALAFYLTDFDVLWTLFAFVMCFPIAYLSFIFVESPAQRISRKIKAEVTA
jgi:peptidoglycan/LPS O-acetylase OafA/YrhL